MKQLVLVVSLGVGMLAVAAAASASESDVVTINAARQGAPIHHIYMSQEDFRPFIEVYDLSDGRALRVFAHGASKFVALDDGQWQQIVATAANAFASLDGRLSLRIDRKENDKVEGEVLIYATPASGQAATSASVQRLSLHAAR